MAQSQGSGNGKLTLYVDLISPFGYMAYWLTRNSPAFTSSNIQITYIPVLLGGIMQACNNSPPLNITNKKDWINIERMRTAKTLRIPVMPETPKPFPQSTVNAQRALCYIYAKKSQTELVKALDALYEAFWVEGVSPIADAKNLEAALGKVLGGEQVKEILQGIKSEEAKATLKKNSDQAFEEGCFGLPWWVATNAQGEKEKFWGVDHVGQVLEHLGVEVQGEDGRYRSIL
ncbi:Glutathione S-transferase kappa [Cercospora zeina]